MSQALNIYSQEWQIIAAFCEEEISALQEQNERDLDDSETASVRGQIRFARKILALADETTPVELISSNNYIE
jgi:hypothetical protein